MGPALHHKSSVRQHSPHHSPDSSAINYPSSRRSPYHEQRSRDRHKSTVTAHSPVRTSGFHRSKSPSGERLPGHKRPKSRESRSPRRGKFEEKFRSPRCSHSRSPEKSKSRHVSRSPSPRSKRLRRAKADYDADKSMDRGSERDTVRDNGRGRHKEYPEKDMPIVKRSLHENNDDRFAGASRHTRSQSPAQRNHRNRHGSPPLPKHMEQEEAKGARRTDIHRDNDEDSIAKMKTFEEALEVKQKKQPTFELSGKLAEETNRFRGVTLLFTEPPDACKPEIRWRLYVFKAGEVLNDPLRVYHQKCYLFGRERRVADIPTDHPSCSKQHAVLQYRNVEKEQPDGLMKKQVRPYLMDLGSTNGTFINDNRVEPQRYYELFEKDTIKFGNSSREYVLLHENSVE